MTECLNIVELIENNPVTRLSNTYQNKLITKIKTNEHSPGTDYLYQNMKSSNLEKTIAKLETMNNLGAEYIPRIE